MAWIRMIDEQDAEGKLSELYRRMQEPDGSVDNILKIHSLNPDSLQGHFEFYRSLMRGRSPLTRPKRTGSCPTGEQALPASQAVEGGAPTADPRRASLCVAFGWEARETCTGGARRCTAASALAGMGLALLARHECRVQPPPCRVRAFRGARNPLR